MKRKEEGRRVRKKRREMTRGKESIFVKERNKSTYHGADENIGIVSTPSTTVFTFRIQFLLRIECGIFFVRRLFPKVRRKLFVLIVFFLFVFLLICAASRSYARPVEHACEMYRKEK